MNDDQTLRTRLHQVGRSPTEEFRARLRNRLESELGDATVVQPTALTPTPPASRPWRWIVTAAAVLIVLVGLVVVRSPDDTVSSPDTTPIGSVSQTTTTTIASTSSDEDLLAALTGAMWILTDAGGRMIPSPVPYLAPLQPGADGLVGTFDGCNNGSADGVIENGRLRLTDAVSNGMACPGVEVINLPGDGALTLADDGRTLTITDAGGDESTLTFRRSDALGAPAEPDRLVGWWSSGDATAANFAADGRLTAGTCARSWSLEDSGALYVYGDSAAVDESCPLRFLDAMANGPFTARVDETGLLWLIGDRAVLRLDPIDEPTATPTAGPFPTIDIAPWRFPIDDLEPCQPERCPSIAVAPDGTIVSYDRASHAITVGQRGSLPARTMPIDDAPPTTGYLIGIGPDDVAYLEVQPAGASDSIGDIIAVPISGPDAGDVVARAPAVADLSGDSQRVATSAGWVSVGCCGFEPVLPLPDGIPLLEWVDRSGAPIDFEGPLFSMERADDTVTFVRTESDGTRETRTIPSDEAFGMRGIPTAALLADGAVILTWWNWAEGGQRLLRLGSDGGIEEIVVPTNISVVALSPFGGAVVYDGSAFHLWQLPGFATPTEIATADLAALTGPGPFTTVDDLVGDLLRTLSAPDGCDVAPTSTVLDRSESPDAVVVTIAARYGCDDSGAGSDITLTLQQGSNGYWFIESGQRRGLCSRGASGDFCM